LGTLLVLALVGFVLYRLTITGQFDPRVWEWIEYQTIQILLIQSLLATLKAFAVAAVLSLLFGAVFAAGRLSDHRWLNRPATVIVEFFRAVPLLILIFILYYGVSRGVGIDIPIFWALVLGLMLYNGSVLAEVFRAGVRALPRGQAEAAYGLGMRKTQVTTYVLLPQAVRAMLPTILSQLVVVLKDTALGQIITYDELLRAAQIFGNGHGNNLQTLTVAALVFIVINWALTAVARWLSRYLSGRTSGTTATGPGIGNPTVITAGGPGAPAAPAVPGGGPAT
ncbi:MAG: amino acid ABC transporter permease, partial [Actinomycetes bacterium]